MIRFLRYCIGTMLFEISGSSVERFFNLCAKQNIVFWDLQPTKQGYCFFVKKSSEETVRLLAEKTSTSLLLERGYGLPYFLSRNRKRKVFFMGVILAAGITYGLSLFVWDMTVSGCEIYSKERILKYVNRKFYHIGEWKRNVNCDLLEEEIREDFPGIAWVSCSLTGTKLHIELKESLDRNTKQNPKKPCDIVSNRSGTITFLSVKSGTPLVSCGEKVKKGDPLISGLIYYYSDDYRVTQTERIKADGQIILRTEEVYYESIPRKQYRKQYISKTAQLYEIGIGSTKIEIPIKREVTHNCDLWKKTKVITLGESFSLPFSYSMQTICQYRTKKIVLSEEEGKQKLKQRLSVYLKNKRKNGIDIDHTKVTFSRKGDHYICKGKIQMKMPVGKIRTIHSLTKKQEEKIAPKTMTE